MIPVSSAPSLQAAVLAHVKMEQDNMKYVCVCVCVCAHTHTHTHTHTCTDYYITYMYSNSLQQQQAVTVSTSLVDESLPPDDVFTHGPLHIISYIKSWKLVPKMFAVVNPTFLKTADVKAWLFKNLPCGHAHNAVIGGEVHVVESILNCLTQPREGGTVDPDSVVMSTQHLLGGSEKFWIITYGVF